jgi:hypothetical protein
MAPQEKAVMLRQMMLVTIGNISKILQISKKVINFVLPI